MHRKRAACRGPFSFWASRRHLCVSSIFRPDFRRAAMLKRAKAIEDFAMTMTRLTLACVLALGLTTGATLAQDTPAPAAPAAPEAPAAPAAAAPAADDGLGKIYVKAAFDAWEQRCVKTADGKDPCQIYQLLKDANGASVAEIGIFPLPAGDKAVTGATIITPLETLLTQHVVVRIDAGEPRVYPFSWCDQSGCIARAGFTAEDVAAMKKGNEMVVTIVPMAAPDQKVNLTVSLKGFTAGYDSIPGPAARP